VQAGRAAGTATAGVLWGAGTHELLTAAEPDHLFDAPQKLHSLLRLN
jgi:phosphoglycolate phosphatase-like HAD superfamily hydrolase